MQPIGDVINNIVKKRNLGDEKELKHEVLHEPKIRQFLIDNRSKINKEIVANSMPNLYEFYAQQKDPNKVMAGYEPELFLNGKVIDVRYHPTEQKIERDKERATMQHLELIDLPKALHNVKLSEVDMNDPGRSEALADIKQFLAKYKQDIHQKGLYLSGNFGVGKTYMLAGLANAVAGMDKKVIFLHVPTFIAGLASHFGDNTLPEEIQRVATCDVLILDDIGAETLSQWSRDDVLGVILQIRMDNLLPTFFSSNLDFASLESHFANTKNAIDKVKAARLMQRVRFLAKEVVVSGKDRRKF